MLQPTHKFQDWKTNVTYECTSHPPDIKTLPPTSLWLTHNLKWLIETRSRSLKLIPMSNQLQKVTFGLHISWPFYVGRVRGTLIHSYYTFMVTALGHSVDLVAFTLYRLIVYIGYCKRSLAASPSGSVPKQRFPTPQFILATTNYCQCALLVYIWQIGWVNFMLRWKLKLCWIVSGAFDQLEVELGLWCFNMDYSVSWYEFVSRGIHS